MMKSSMIRSGSQSRVVRGPPRAPRVAGTRSMVMRNVTMQAARPDTQFVQLGTARIPKECDSTAFANSIYQWASSLTQSGANYPFVLPLKTDKLDKGFTISLLKRSSTNAFDSAGDIEATVESVEGQGEVLFIRFYEGPAALASRTTDAPSDPLKRLNLTLDQLVDVPTIMQTMPNAIRNAVVFSKA